MSTVLVWDLPTRVFHWLLAVSFFGAYVSGDADGYRTLHVLLGYTAAGLVPAAGARPLVALVLAGVVLAFWSGVFKAPGMRTNPGLIAALTQPDVDAQRMRRDERRERRRGAR